MVETPHHLLYVDDDAGLCRLVARFCGRIGWTVTVAATPDEGLALARCGGFDAVALDHYMPGRDGLDVLPELLACPDAPPVIFVTAAEEPRIAVTALKAGAADYVVKDVGGHFLELLVAAVRQAVAQRALHRAKEAAEQAAREGMARLELLTEQQAVLLREMNHRIANSLQLITALLGMHARRSDDETIKEALRQAGERVEAVAKIHRRLYTSADIGHVDMDDYLRGLLAEMERVSSGSVAHIVLTCDPVRLPTDKAISVGLIVSELVTNAVKYAYGAGENGAVRVELRRRGADHGGEGGGGEGGGDGSDGGGGWLLAVEDDGPGFTPDAEPRGTGLGTIIVNTMARSLHASVRHDLGRQGTRVEIDIPT